MSNKTTHLSAEIGRLSVVAAAIEEGTSCFELQYADL
jgi:hypothetical protein